MMKYASRVKQRLRSLSVWRLEHVPRNSNGKADALASVPALLPVNETIVLPIYYQPGSSIASDQVSQVDEVTPTWMDAIVRYIQTGELPDEKIRPTRFKSNRLDFL